MASLNKVILIGNLGRDPETRYMPSGDAICNFTIATTETWKDKQTGEKKEATEWHRISFFGRQAEIAGQYLKKGSQVYVEGSLRTRKYQDKETGADRYATEIRGDEFKMLGSRGGGGGGGGDHEQGGAGNGQPQGQQGQRGQQPQQQGASAYEQQSQGSGQRRPPARPASGGGGAFGDMDDDIPFTPLARGIACYVL